MGKILIINGSPRAPRSNSRQYAELFAKAYPDETVYFNITRANHLEICRAMEGVENVLFVFPLYADGIPVTLLNFLKTLEENGPRHKPKVSLLINRENGYPFGSVLEIGSGEAILSTPFRILVRSKIRKLASAIMRQTDRSLKVTMPITKRMFLKASTSYWERYGKRNGITKEQMATMKIEE